MQRVGSSVFQETIEQIERLPIDDQMLLVEIIRQRIIQHRRNDLVEQVAKAREAYRSGNVRRGTVEDFLQELEAEEE